MKQNHILNIGKIKKIVFGAGKILLDGSGKQLIIKEKTSYKDFVTQFDTLIQDYIKNEIRKLMPDAQFIAEESDVVGKLDADNLFIIDPIDGTTNFAHMMNHSAISLAWYRNEIPIYAIVLNPYTNDCFEAQNGNGAFLNSKKIFVNNLSLCDSIVAFGTSPYNLNSTDQTFEMIKEIFGKCQDIRRLGSAALDICLVAAGKISLYFEAALSLWDYAAAQLILKEAGGVIVDFNGNQLPFSLKKSSVIVGSESIIRESMLIKSEGV